jgi:glycosyltransferase involved in cell wall biosynthesis
VQNRSKQETTAAGSRSVAIIVTVCDHARFLADALQSCRQQTVQPAEIILVHCGSREEAGRIAASFPGVMVYRQDNANRSIAQSVGLARVSSEFSVFLDADERLTPLAIEAGLECFDKNPDAWLVGGTHRVIDAAGRPTSLVWHERLRPQQSLALLRGGNVIAMQAAVMYRTDRLRSTRGSDATQKAPESNMDVRGGRIAIHDRCVAEYRYAKRLMLARSVVGLQKNDENLQEADVAGQSGRRPLLHRNAPHIFKIAAKEIISNGWNWKLAKIMVRAARIAPFALLRAIISRGVQAITRHLPRSIGRVFGEALWVPKVGSVCFGDFGRTKPISTDDGFDRGKPIDRYYIELALESRSELVRGRVLEVGARGYTRSFGAAKVECSDVLDIDPLNPFATIVGDLGVVGALPEAAFDCILLTQTLQYVYNLDNAVENLFRALAPGGALLITVPGISPIDETAMYWQFTELSLKLLLSSRFGDGPVQVQSYGNVFAAICFLTGLSLAEVGSERLEVKDERYPVTVFACARKPRSI